MNLTTNTDNLQKRRISQTTKYQTLLAIWRQVNNTIRLLDNVTTNQQQ